MDAREWVLTKHLKAHDASLYCARLKIDGPYCVLQKPPHRASSPVLVFPLTDTWTMQGTPRDWGIEPVLQRVKEHRPERQAEQVDELIRSYQKRDEASERHLHSESEAFAKDFRGQYAKAFNDINTSTLEKVDSRRKNGNY